MGLSNFLRSLRGATTGYDDTYVSAKASRIAHELSQAAEELQVRRAERAEAQRLREAQFDDLKRSRQRQQYEDLKQHIRSKVAWGGAMAQLPSDLGISEEMLAGVDNPEPFVGNATAAAMADFLAERSKSEEGRKLKTDAEKEREKADIRAEERALRNAKALAGFRAGLEPDRPDRIPHMTPYQAYQRASARLSTRVKLKDGTFVTQQAPEPQVRALAEELLAWDRERRTGGGAEADRPPSLLERPGSGLGPPVGGAGLRF